MEQGPDLIAHPDVARVPTPGRYSWDQKHAPCHHNHTATAPGSSCIHKCVHKKHHVRVYLSYTKPQSLTAPSIIPLMKYFCRNGYRHTMGKVVTIT